MVFSNRRCVGDWSRSRSNSSLFNIELLALISDSEGATTTVAEEKDDEVAAANDSPTVSYELALTVNVSLDSIEV